jgi:DNA-binding NarL/FixJ family response regulator
MRDIQTFIADDHPIIRHGMKQIIEMDKELTIIGEAANGKAALDEIIKLAPDVAVLDIDMPEMDGLTVAQILKQKNLAVEIVVLTIHREEALFHAAIDAGVKGYVLKESAMTDIVSSIKAAAAGQPYISPALSAYLLGRNSRSASLQKEKPGIKTLSPTEKRILKLIAEEKTTKEIADELFISPRTVETHRTNIGRKLELHGPLAVL